MVSEGMRFDKTVTFGNVLTIATIVLAFLLAWAKMDSRVSAVEAVSLENRAAIAQERIVSDQIEENSTRLTTLMDSYVLPQIEHMNDSQEGRKR